MLFEIISSDTIFIPVICFDGQFSITVPLGYGLRKSGYYICIFIISGR